MSDGVNALLRQKVSKWAAYRCLTEFEAANDGERNPTTAPGRRNHGRVPFSRHPAQSMVVILGTGRLVRI